MSFLDLIYLMAIGSCGIQGAKKGLQKQLGIADILACSYLSALGGGIVRDIFILQAYPVALTNKCLLEIAVSLVFGLLYLGLGRYRKRLEIFSMVSDAAGLSQFIAKGADNVHNNNIVAVLSAITTALLGGMASSIFSGESIKEIIFSNFAYRIITLGGAIVYVVLTECGIKDTDAQGILALYTLLFIAISDSDIRAENMQYFIKLSKCIQQNELFRTHSSCNSIFLQMHICNEHYFCKLPINSFTKPTQSYTSNRSAVFLLHRIRRM